MRVGPCLTSSSSFRGRRRGRAFAGIRAIAGSMRRGLGLVVGGSPRGGLPPTACQGFWTPFVLSNPLCGSATYGNEPRSVVVAVDAVAERELRSLEEPAHRLLGDVDDVVAEPAAVRPALGVAPSTPSRFGLGVTGIARLSAEDVRELRPV